MTGMSGWNITVVIVVLLAGFFGVAMVEAIWQHAVLSDLQGYFTVMFPLLGTFLGLGAGGLATYALKNQQTQALQDQNQNLKDISRDATAAAAAADERVRSATQAARYLSAQLSPNQLEVLSRAVPEINDVLGGPFRPTAPPSTPAPPSTNGVQIK